MGQVQVQVRATFRGPDGTTPVGGQVEFRLTEPLRDPDENEILAASLVVTPVDPGTGVMAAVSLVANDSPNCVPTNTRYWVTTKITGAAPHTRRILVPAAAAAAGLDLPDAPDA